MQKRRPASACRVERREGRLSNTDTSTKKKKKVDPMSRYLVDVDEARVKPLDLIHEVRGILATEPSLNSYQWIGMTDDEKAQ